MSLQKLNKINSSAVQSTLDATSYEESINIYSQHGEACGEYRNALLKSLEGNVVKFKGYLSDEAKHGNYTLTCVEIKFKGSTIDTLQHLNVFRDLLANHSIWVNGSKMMGEGKYDLRDISDAANKSKCNNLATQDCMVVEGEGTVYRYGNKYSIGTDRQVAWALANK